jgi:hypothetical protein
MTRALPPQPREFPRFRAVAARRAPCTPIANPNQGERTMGTANWQPKWWTEEHATGWAKVKEALKRDWEQTKSDLHMGGRDLDQNVGDTVKQATGKEPIPSRGLGWDDAEQPLMYGYGARQRYGTQHREWNDDLESTLRTDWEHDHGGAGDTLKHKWEDVKNVVRHGFDRART